MLNDDFETFFHGERMFEEKNLCILVVLCIILKLKYSVTIRPLIFDIRYSAEYFKRVIFGRIPNRYSVFETSLKTRQLISLR